MRNRWLPFFELRIGLACQALKYEVATPYNAGIILGRPDEYRRGVYDGFLGFLRNAAYETIEKAPDECDKLAKCIHFWIDFVFPRIKKRGGNEMGYLEYRLKIFVFKAMDEIYIMGISGAYLNAFRTLRFIFEMLVQARALEGKYPSNISEKDKLEFVLSKLKEIDKEKRSFKMSMISELRGFNDEEKRDLKGLYALLSMYSHPTRKQMETPFGKRAIFAFDKDEFEKLVETTVKVTDLMIVMTVMTAPSLANEVDDYVRADIEELDMRLSRSRLAIQT